MPTDDPQHTRSPGVFVAGNASVDLQVAIVAAAEGFKAAYAINDELVSAEMSLGGRGRASSAYRLKPKLLPFNRPSTAG